MSIDDRLRALRSTLDEEIPLPPGLRARLLGIAAASAAGVGPGLAPAVAPGPGPAESPNGGKSMSNASDERDRARGRRPRRRLWLAALSTAAAAVVAVAAYVTLTPQKEALANEVRSLGASCPASADLVPLADGDVDRLQAVIDKIVKAQYPDEEYAQYEVTMMKPARDVMVYGDMAVNFCGEAVADSTYLIQLHFPALEPSASLSQGQLFATKTTNGWDVWFKYH